MDSLKNKKEFDVVYKKGIKKYSKNFTLYFLKMNSLDTYFKNKSLEIDFLLGLSVSKKVGKATKRNLIKRRFRAICKEHIEKIRKFAIIFVAKQTSIEVSYKELEKEFLNCFNSLKSAKTKIQYNQKCYYEGKK